MKKYPIIFFLLLLTAVQLNAQEFRTDESITKQLKNNSVPGLQYAAGASSAKPQVQPHTTLIEEIRNGKYAPVKTGAGTARSFARPAQPNTADLPSNKSATDAARAATPAQKAPAVQTPPTQEGGSDAAAGLKAVPAKNAKLIAVKKDQQ